MKPAVVFTVLGLILPLYNAQFNYNSASGEASFNGRLTCGGEDLTDIPIVTIRLWEDDLGKHNPFDSDDLLGTTRVRPDGKFYIKGYQKETAFIQFYIEILHKCGGTCRSYEIRSKHFTKTIEIKNEGEEFEGCAKHTWEETQTDDNM